ncbi:helix-turn-helix transcriptional regulator [Streptomyces sp. NA02950]|nr:helix-turn-helix transcriptional regulator [Streptomyces sp. NA02950]
MLRGVADGTRGAQRQWAIRTARDRRDARTRTLLLDAAEAVFARRGYARTTVADITGEARLSRASFYVYFASKEEVFRELAVRARDAFLAAQEIPGVDVDDAHALAEATVAAFLDAYVAHLPLLGLIEQQAPVDDLVQAVWQEIQERPMHRMARYVRRLVGEGKAAPAAAPLAVARAVAGMNARFAQLIAESPRERDQAVRDLTAMYLHLLGVPPRGRK